MLEIKPDWWVHGELGGIEKCDKWVAHPCDGCPSTKHETMDGAEYFLRYHLMTCPRKYQEEAANK